MSHVREKKTTVLDVLIIEDNPGDVRLVRDTLRGVNGALRLHEVTDGVDAMAFLRREGAYQAMPRPKLILMDLTLPKLDGREVLGLIKGDEGLKTIPIIILTSSTDEADIRQCYELQANCYLSKPGEIQEFENVIKSVNDFWLMKVKFMSAVRD